MDEQEIRVRVEKRIKEQNEFYVHLGIYIMVMALLWVIYGFTSDFFSALFGNGTWDIGGFPWPLIPMMGWGIGIVAHGLTVYFNSPGRVAAREALIEREIERERERLERSGYVVEKAKRDSREDEETRYRLSDDGEIIEEETGDEEYRRKRRS